MSSSSTPRVWSVVDEVQLEESGSISRVVPGAISSRVPVLHSLLRRRPTATERVSPVTSPAPRKEKQRQVTFEKSQEVPTVNKETTATTTQYRESTKSTEDAACISSPPQRNIQEDLRLARLHKEALRNQFFGSPAPVTMPVHVQTNVERERGGRNGNTSIPIASGIPKLYSVSSSSSSTATSNGDSVPHPTGTQIPSTRIPGRGQSQSRLTTIAGIRSRTATNSAVPTAAPTTIGLRKPSPTVPFYMQNFYSPAMNRNSNINMYRSPSFPRTTGLVQARTNYWNQQGRSRSHSPSPAAVATSVATASQRGFGYLNNGSKSKEVMQNGANQQHTTPASDTEFMDDEIEDQPGLLIGQHHGTHQHRTEKSGSSGSLSSSSVSSMEKQVSQSSNRTLRTSTRGSRSSVSSIPSCRGTDSEAEADQHRDRSKSPNKQPKSQKQQSNRELWETPKSSLFLSAGESKPKPNKLPTRTAARQVNNNQSKIIIPKGMNLRDSPSPTPSPRIHISVSPARRQGISPNKSSMSPNNNNNTPNSTKPVEIDSMELLEELRTIHSQLILLKEVIHDGEVTIDELRRENDELRDLLRRTTGTVLSTTSNIIQNYDD